MENQLRRRVRPGVADVRASPFLPVSELMSDDLPTLERPANATSGSVAGGNPDGDEADVMNVAFLARRGMTGAQWLIFCQALAKSNGVTVIAESARWQRMHEAFA